MKTLMFFILLSLSLCSYGQTKPNPSAFLKKNKQFKSKFEDKITDLFKKKRLHGDFIIGIVDETGLVYSFALNRDNEESLNFLIEVVEEMQNHPSLRLRISLKKEEDKSELRAKREEALNEFFIQKNSINEARLIFGDAEEEDSSDTLQFFDRK